MIRAIGFDASLFIVSIGRAPPDEIANPVVAAYPARGLILRQTTTSGDHAELFIKAPGDLLGYADMQALSILKPVVLPIEIAEIYPGRINAKLRSDPLAAHLSRIMLSALAVVRNPAPAGSLKTSKRGE